jgi:hypothetical protein
VFLTWTVRAPVPATPVDRPATRRRGSRPTLAPDTGGSSNGRRHRRSVPELPTSGRRYGCTRHDAPGNCGCRSTNGAQLSPFYHRRPPAQVAHQGLRRFRGSGHLQASSTPRRLAPSTAHRHGRGAADSAGRVDRRAGPAAHRAPGGYPRAGSRRTWRSCSRGSASPSAAPVSPGPTIGVNGRPSMSSLRRRRPHRSTAPKSAPR